jgi:hypothetical protein
VIPGLPPSHSAWLREDGQSPRSQRHSQAAQRVNWACDQILTPPFNAQYSFTESYSAEHGAVKVGDPTTDSPVKQRVGIDTSSLFIARTGIRGSNDLVWVENAVENAANNAAETAALDPRYPTYISAHVSSSLTTSSTGGEHNQGIGTNLCTSALGYRINGSILVVGGSAQSLVVTI